MHPIIIKTFGGLTPKYYFRHLFFSLVLGLPLIYSLVLTTNSPQHGQTLSNMQFSTGMLLLLLSTVLYPYSRFVYESVTNFIFGDNVFFGGLFIMLMLKFFWMLICWFFAIFIAPIGLVYLYFVNSRSAPTD